MRPHGKMAQERSVIWDAESRAGPASFERLVVEPLHKIAGAGVELSEDAILAPIDVRVRRVGSDF